MNHFWKRSTKRADLERPASKGTRAIAAILLLQVNLALAARPAAAQQQSQTPTPPTQTAPEAPAPVTAGTTAAPASLAQEIKQDQQPLFAPPQPFHVPMPHSHNPLAP